MFGRMHSHCQFSNVMLEKQLVTTISGEMETTKVKVTDCAA